MLLLSNLSQNGQALTANEDGSFTLTVHSIADLAGLTTTPAEIGRASCRERVEITVVAGSVKRDTVSHDAELTVNQLPETPVFTASADTTAEDGTSAVTITFAKLDELYEVVW